MKDYRFLQKKYIVPGYPDRGIVFVRGDGICLIDEQENRYLDVMSNIGVNIFGYNHPKVISTLTNQLRQLTNLHGSFTSDIRAKASQALVRRCGTSYAKVYWANSGAEAIEAALKFAVLKTGKKKFIAAHGGFHGKTLGALSATSGEKYRKSFEPLLWEFIHVAFDNAEAVNSAFDDDVAAVILEPIQGENGIVIPSKNYLRNVRELCNKKGILLILDEIQTGVGRTGTFLASQASEVAADIVCLGKGLAAGLPVGVTVVTEKIIESIPRGIHTSTFGGNPFTCAGVLVTLELLDNRMLSHVKELGSYIVHKLQIMKSGKIIEVRGVGLMIGIEVGERRNDILKALQKEKILSIPAGEGVVRFLPPYIIEKEQIDIVVSVLKDIL